jgi:hypothetical protein
MADGPTLFPHRRNEDGSFDSICPTCFATIARSKAEGGLAENEAAYVCDSAFLEGRGHFSRAGS